MAAEEKSSAAAFPFGVFRPGSIRLTPEMITAGLWPKWLREQDMVGAYWKRVVWRALRRSLELVRLESWERVAVFLIGLLVPAAVVWFFVSKDAATIIRVLASLGASFIAVAFIFGWGLLKLPAIMDAEAEAARRILLDQQETVAQRKMKQDALGAFLEQGTALMSRSRDFQKEPPESEANEWLGELIDYLQANLGKAYVARVNDGASAPVGYSSQHKEHDALYNGIRIRVFHLQEFLKELATI